MDKILKAFLLVVFSQTLVITMSSNQDLIGLNSLNWTTKPPNWKGSDPCGANWEGIGCSKSRVTTIKLQSMGLKGQLSGEIEQLSELEILDLSSNKELTGLLPQSIGNLKKLQNLILVGCSFYGQIPHTIGSLRELVILALNSNNFNGSIPPSIGNLSKLEWLDITDNNIAGPIPISNKNSPGLDMLIVCKHFHLGKNKLTGPIPEKLFSSNMSLLHVILDGNKLGSSIPSTLALLHNLTFLDMEDTELEGEIPRELFNLPNLETVKLKNNMLSGKLEMGPSHSSHLQLIDLRKNSITEFENRNELHNVQIILEGNPICQETVTTKSYCNSISVSQPNSSYVTERNNCSPSPCGSDQISSPNCKCAYPYKGTLVIASPFISDLGNTTYFKDLEISLPMELHTLDVDSVSLSNPTKYSSEYLKIRLDVFPQSRDRFSQAAISDICYALNYKVTIPFRPLYFVGDAYEIYAGIQQPIDSKKSRVGTVVGAAIIVFALVLLLLSAVYLFRQKKRAISSKHGNLFGRWNTKSGRGSIPDLKGGRRFSFRELKQYTNNFSAENDMGSGGYGKVYRGTLPTGELIAIKRAKRETMQGDMEFKAEIEILSRVYHKNLVTFVGFCFEQCEQMLIYEYVPNGNLKDTLSGKSGIRFDWRKRLKVALDTARGLAYLHELVHPPIIHRYIKSTNVLLDDRLNAKVANFGLSKLTGDGEKDGVRTRVKGTMGYLDPDYFMTQQLTEKSNIFSFGVLMLELITARNPIERGTYIVREVRETLNKSKNLYNLQALLDPTIGMETRLNGFERFLELAMRCVENERANGPIMSEVVKEIESIMQLAGVNPNEDSTSTSTNYEESIMASSFNPYSEHSLS